MNRAILLLPLVLASVAGCDAGGRSAAGAPSATATASAPSPVIRATLRIDAAHDAIKDGPPYAIAPATELVLDGSGHVFDPGPPNSIHVVHGPSEYWRATFAGKWPVALNAAALDPMKGGAFTRFEPGEPYLVAVGAEVTLADGTMKFAPAWVGKVVVTAP